MVILMLAVLIWNRALHLAARRQGEKLSLEQSARLSSELKTKERSRLAVELHDSISQVLTGAYISHDVAKLLASDPPVEPLTPRQKDILGSIVRGLSNNDIAKELGITPTAVREHTIALFQKLRAANRTEATAIALRKHLLPDP